MSIFNYIQSIFSAVSQSNGKANKRNPSPNLKLWQQRWEVFSPNEDGFIWYGVDSEGNIAQFICEDSYIPEDFFDDVSKGQKLEKYFDELPEITTAKLPKNHRFKSIASGKYLSGNLIPSKESNKGIYVFDEANDAYWYKSGNYKHYSKNPYELMAIPERELKVSELPKDIQKMLERFHFQNIKFADFDFLDVSKFFECIE